MTTPAPESSTPQLDEKRLRQILELERIKVAQGVKAILDVIKGRQWLSEEGRGPYSYDDERYQKEFGYALNEISAALKPLEAIAGDLTDCPTKPEEVQECWRMAAPATCSDHIAKSGKMVPGCSEVVERLLELASAAQCLYCRGDEAVVDVEQVTASPIRIDEQYVPNCGTMGGWVHQRSWGGFAKCDATDGTEKKLN